MKGGASVVTTVWKTPHTKRFSRSRYVFGLHIDSSFLKKILRWGRRTVMHSRCPPKLYILMLPIGDTTRKERRIPKDMGTGLPTGKDKISLDRRWETFTRTPTLLLLAYPLGKWVSQTSDSRVCKVSSRFFITYAFAYKSRTLFRDRPHSKNRIWPGNILFKFTCFYKVLSDMNAPTEHS